MKKYYQIKEYTQKTTGETGIAIGEYKNRDFTLWRFRPVNDATTYRDAVLILTGLFYLTFGTSNTKAILSFDSIQEIEL